MVVGLDVFKKYFEQFPDNYIIIGGTACDIIIGEAGFIPRATKDIDIILIVEALSPEMRISLFKLNCSQEHPISLFCHKIHILLQFQWMIIYLVCLQF